MPSVMKKSFVVSVEIELKEKGSAIMDLIKVVPFSAHRIKATIANPVPTALKLRNRKWINSLLLLKK